MLVAVLWRCTWGRGWEGAKAPAPLSTGFQPLPPPPTIKLGPSGAGSRVGGLVHTLGPCGSLQRPLLGGWESLLLPPQPPWALSIRGLRLYFPALEPWVVRSATIPTVCPVYLCANVGLRGLLVVRLPAPFVPHSTSLGPATDKLPVSTPPPGLDDCLFFISLVSDFLASIFCQFWLCEEAQCVYLHRHLGSPPIFITFNILNPVFIFPQKQVYFCKESQGGETTDDQKFLHSQLCYEFQDLAYEHNLHVPLLIIS